MNSPRPISRFAILRLVLLCLLPAVRGRAELIGYDGFDYEGPSIQGKAGGSFWGYKNSIPDGHTGGISDWDDAPGFGAGTPLPSGGKLFTNDSGAIREYNGPTSTDEESGAINESSVAKKVYYRITVTPGSVAWFGLSSFDLGTERLFFGMFPDGTGKFSIYDQNTFTRLALSSQTVTSGQTYTLVAKLDYEANQVALYVNPNLNNAETSSFPVASATYTATYWSTGLRIASSGLASWDDLMVATTWESLRTYTVFNTQNDGSGSLREAMVQAAGTGGRITFDPSIGAVFAVTGANRLYRFSRTSPGTLDLDVPIVGLEADMEVVALDFRPSTGELYALGNVPSLKVAVPNPHVRLYKINTSTGVATAVGTSFSTTLGDFGAMGFDFQPKFLAAEEVIWLTNEAGDNVRISPNGWVASVETPLSFPNVPPVGRMQALAFSENWPGSEHPTLYGIDNYARLVAIGGLQGNPASGQVTTLGEAGVILPEIGGFDIGDDGVAMAVARPSSGDLNGLYKVDLQTGRFTLVGRIGNGTQYIRALAMAPTRITLQVNPITPPSSSKAIVVDGPASAPGVTVAGRKSQQLFSLNGSFAFRNLNFMEGSDNQGGAISYGGAAVGGLLSFERCSFFENVASSRGGAIFLNHGNLRMHQCCVTNNGGGASAGFALCLLSPESATLSHCTIVDNAGRVASPAGYALELGSATTISDSIIAGNKRADGTAADLQPVSASAVSGTLVGNGTGTGLTSGAFGNQVGTASSPLKAKLAALGDYGGPTRSRPPLPASPAVGLAISSKITSDQRGLAMNGVRDAGAAEFQGKNDLRYWWKTDWDADGMPFGTEFVFGLDPLVANNTPALRIEAGGSAPVAGSTHHLFMPGTADPSTTAYARWRIMRSPSLEYLGISVADYNQTAPSALSGSTGHTWQFGVLFFSIPPSDTRAFYRLEAEILP